MQIEGSSGSNFGQAAPDEISGGATPSPESELAVGRQAHIPPVAMEAALPNLSDGQPQPHPDSPNTGISEQEAQRIREAQELQRQLDEMETDGGWNHRDDEARAA